VTEEKIKLVIKKLEDVRGEMNTVGVMNRRLTQFPLRSVTSYSGKLNIAIKLPMRSPSQLAVKAINETHKAEMERIVIEC